MDRHEDGDFPCSTSDNSLVYNVCIIKSPGASFGFVLNKVQNCKLIDEKTANKGTISG